MSRRSRRSARRTAPRPTASLHRRATATPADPKALRRLLDGYLDRLEAPPEIVPEARGVLSPHIDYQRGGLAYARTWASAAEAAREAELIVVFATDHNAPTNRITLTRQHYATPYGVLPTDQEVVAGLAAVIGEEAAFADELHHISEHAIELPLTWLHHMRAGAPCRVVPILCGSFQPFIEDARNPWDDATLNAVIDYLRPVVSAPKTLVMASGDLAHMGPAFGGSPLGLVERAQVQVADNRLIENLVAGSAEGFFCAIKDEGDRRNVCGTAPFYMALRALSPARGVRAAYDRCPADDHNTSVVSIAGVVMG
ncbi:MAG: AmmeMemoRadiSam system protein B [Anaerolineae bacterium]|nr:AmmeMemoRadiSam system protein B [Anaerolineae bacterium]